ncbi:MAG: DUF433 domain-containing protein [Phycisphaerae bacterium]
MEILGHGIYTAPEASRLSGVSSRCVRYWFRGDGKRGPALGIGDYSDTPDDSLLLSFHDLIDVKVVGAIREKGVPLQYLRKIHSRLIEELGTRHPFARKDFYTDGKAVWVNEKSKEGEMIREILSGQHAFPTILKPFLESIEYDEHSLMAEIWHIGKGIIIDPEIRYGKPVVEGTGIPAELLAMAYQANGEDPEIVAEWYDVSPAEVEAAVAFQRRILGKAA